MKTSDMIKECTYKNDKEIISMVVFTWTCY